MAIETIKIRIEIDRTAAVLAGYTKAGTVDVEIPKELTPAQRETLVTLNRAVSSNYVYDLTTDGVRSVADPKGPTYGGDLHPTLPVAADGSAATIGALLDAFPAAVEAYRAQVKEYLRQEVQKGIETGKWLAEDLLNRADPSLVARYREVAAEREEKARADREAKQAKAKAERLAKRAREEAAEAEKKANIAAWIEAHGSPRLRRLLKEGFDLDAVYRDERLAIERPGWVLGSPGDTEDPRNAPTAALDMLDEARKTEPAARLQYFKSDDARGYLCESTFMGRWMHFEPRVLIDDVADGEYAD